MNSCISEWKSPEYICEYFLDLENESVFLSKDFVVYSKSYKSISNYAKIDTIIIGNRPVLM